MQILIAIVGPTGVGKTKISIALAKGLQAEIISSDSMQVYRKLDIGTAKITPAETEGVVHHLLDICDPTASFSVAEYQRAAYAAMDDVWERGKQPLMVGGTGLYLNAVIYGYNFAKEAVNVDLRKKLFAEAEQFGSDHLHQKLAELDPKVAERLHPNDAKRIVRALEVAMQSATSLADLEEANLEINFLPLVFGLRRERDVLYERINQRVDLMLEQGLIEEVSQLWHNRLLGPIAKQALGYKEVVDYLRGLSTKREMVEILKRESRRYAKRQMTWFRKNKEIIWFDLTDKTSVAEIVEQMMVEYAGLVHSIENL